MYKEKERVSKLETIIARMHNGVYENQRELMQAVVKTLCTSKKQIQTGVGDWRKDYNYSPTTFEETEILLKRVGLVRTSYGIVKAEHVI